MILQDTTMHQESQGFDPNDVALVTQPGQVSYSFRKPRVQTLHSLTEHELVWWHHVEKPHWFTEVEPS